MIREECKKRPLVGVEFKATANKFEVIFKKDVQSVLDEIDKGILKILSVPKKSSEIAKELGISKPTVLLHLKKLEGLRLIKKEGRTLHIKYRTV